MKLEDMTVPELRDLATKHNVPVPSGAVKDDIIAALKKAKVKPPEGNGDEGPAGKEAPAPRTEPEPEPPPVDPYADFAAPDGTKPILNDKEPANLVTVIVLDGSNACESDEDHLVFVESGVRQEWLTEKNAGRKFVQDKTGQVFYHPDGVAPTDDLKTVDIVAMGT